MRQREVGESDVGCTKAAGERRRVVRLRVRNMLGGDLMLPEVVGNLGLRDTAGREVGILPRDGAIACQLGPVALCSLSSAHRSGRSKVEMLTFHAGVP